MIHKETTLREMPIRGSLILDTATGEFVGVRVNAIHGDITYTVQRSLIHNDHVLLPEKES